MTRFNLVRAGNDLGDEEAIEGSIKLDLTTSTSSPCDQQYQPPWPVTDSEELSMTSSSTSITAHQNLNRRPHNDSHGVASSQPKPYHPPNREYWQGWMARLKHSRDGFPRISQEVNSACRLLHRRPANPAVTSIARETSSKSTTTRHFPAVALTTGATNHRMRHLLVSRSSTDPLSINFGHAMYSKPTGQTFTTEEEIKTPSPPPPRKII